MFWALEQRKKMRKAFRDEIVAQTERSVITQLEAIADENGNISTTELRDAFKKVRSNSNGRDNK